MQLEFAVKVANTNASAAKHCPNLINAFFIAIRLLSSAVLIIPHHTTNSRFWSKVVEIRSVIVEN